MNVGVFWGGKGGDEEAESMGWEGAGGISGEYGGNGKGREGEIDSEGRLGERKC
jgi:hypothetical protein